MNNIVLVDCSAEATRTIAGLLADTCSLSNRAFSDDFNPDNARMILIEIQGPVEASANKVSTIRKSCGFRAVPIIVLKDGDDFATIEHLIGAGATEVLSLDAPPAACRQILQGHLIPNRTPLEKEMEYLEKMYYLIAEQGGSLAFINCDEELISLLNTNTLLRSIVKNKKA